MSQCLFDEPWVGQCKNEARPDELTCEQHKDRCSVCGLQATTRCQASIGVMCGVPLCYMCGEGQMCLQHASSGPLWALRAVLGLGPVQSVFSTQEMLEAEKARMDAVAADLRRRFVR